MRWRGKQTIRFISVGHVCLMNSFCCTLFSWQMITNLFPVSLSLRLSFPLQISHPTYPLMLLLLFFPLLTHSLTFSFPQSVSCLQALTCSPTAPRSARLSVTPTAAGCHPSCRLTGARGQTTAATCTCLAWTQRSLTLRYPPPSTSLTNSPWPLPPPLPTIGHSPPLARMVRGHSHTTAFTITSINNNSSTTPALWRGKSMIGGPYHTNPPFSVSISMKIPWDPMTLVWSSTDTKGGDTESASWFWIGLLKNVLLFLRSFEK